MRNVTENAVSKSRRGFTLVELVVVVLVLGIIAAVASPKMFDTTAEARDSSTKSTLQVVRDAIELYKAETGVYPGDLGTDVDFKADLVPYINGAFPSSKVTGAAEDGSVTIKTAGTPLVKDDATDWMFDNVSGQFIINQTGYETL